MALNPRVRADQRRQVRCLLFCWIRAYARIGVAGSALHFVIQVITIPRDMKILCRRWSWRVGRTPVSVARGLDRPRKAMRPLLVAFLAMFLAAAAVLAAGETVFVTMKRVSIRKDRQFYAPTVAEAVFRDQLVVLAREKDWVRVRFNGLEGWVHVSATAAKAVSVTAKDATGGVSQDDVAFASKGFDSTVEREYGKSKPQANFADVDRMEQLAVSEKTLTDFRQAGNLRPRGDKK